VTSESSSPVRAKISGEFASRLRQLEPGQQVRVVLFLEVPTFPAQASRQDETTRQAAVKTLKRSGQRALNDIDRILEHHGGTRLNPSPNSLGALSVETTAAGISALASSKWIRSILEDQPISLVG